MVRPEGFEPPTPRFEAWYSIQLSYRRALLPIVLHSDSFGKALLRFMRAIFESVTSFFTNWCRLHQPGDGVKSREATQFCRAFTATAISL
jgi:hypothetical protein